MNGRCPNWPNALAAFIESRRHSPFNWAENNCCFFACDWVQILLGVDPAAPWRGRLKSKADVDTVMQVERSVDELAERICADHGWPQSPLSLLWRGDVVLWDVPQIGPALGVCTGELSWTPGLAGLVSVSTLKCRRGWRLG